MTENAIIIGPAQRLRDRAAKSIGTVVGPHRDHSVVGESLARHSVQLNPAAV
jgi:hypothetical protein